MAMNIQSIASLPDRINQIRLLTAEIVNKEILPNENTLWRFYRDGTVSESEIAEARELRGHIKDRVKEAGLWAPHLPEEYGGCGLTFLEHAYMNEVLAYATGAAALFGVVAPNSGNQKILLKYGTEEQRKKWLVPLTEGKMESGFSMTEPDNAGSDPRSIKTTARREGDEWVINGHKWFTSNGSRSDFLIVMCRTDDPEGPAERNGKMTQIIVPTDTPGVNIVRDIEVWGRIGGHAEVIYEDVRVPLENQLGQTGSGHAAAQDRLGAGRVYHCMNSVGQMWRAFDLMVERAQNREVHGGLLAEKQFVQGFIADSYIDIQSSRLMTLHCAEQMESGADARTAISAIKISVPEAYTRVVDRAIQVWGAAGVTGDLPLSAMYQGARILRIADGPDEVHKILIAKNVLKQYRSGDGWDFGN
ncbi:MAG: acyl-CoA dehydrogenase family protein [Myxococcota bacterium]|jgi:acyl-CoA dehydrogenase|nr:acyl-CoA dehydrogenase family protein [Myxococcota bacterium]MDP7074435.1 acyl-CoA dehydrogenase family protein [Myxococcota bacterium]MDP7434188.1 acyl-CoA dehydrogenase family protein [Myxococcota bacterium]HJO25385.1 acyl-CoA dehydrogenase family protein [Myxococcota bacterium]